MAFKSQSDIINYDINSIDNLNGIQITISPNPASEYIVVKKHSDVGMSLSITDIHGRATDILNQPLTEIDNRFDISNLSRGMYEIILESDRGQLSSQRFIKE